MFFDFFLNNRILICIICKVINYKYMICGMGIFFGYGYDYNILINFGFLKVFMLLLMVIKVRYGNLMVFDYFEMILS